MNSAPQASNEWPWPDSLDALVAAPDHHRLLFENENVRVLEVRIGPGQFVPVHTHRWPCVMYVKSAAHHIRRDQDGKIMYDTRDSGAPLPAPQTIRWLDPIPPHSVENVSDVEILLISVEIKHPQAKSGAS